GSLDAFRQHRECRAGQVSDDGIGALWHGGLQQACRLLEQLITCKVTLQVVELLESDELNQAEKGGGILLFGFELLPEYVIESLPVGQARHGALERDGPKVRY